MPPDLIVVYDEGFDTIVNLAIEILGGQSDNSCAHAVTGISRSSVLSVQEKLTHRDQSHVLVISTRCLDSAGYNGVVDDFDDIYDHEYLFSNKGYVRRDLVRFLSFVLGQSCPDKSIREKARSSYVCLTFPNINVALPNLAIVSVGADALELRVDLLSQRGSAQSKIPDLDYVAEQFFALRARTELPIIFTLRTQSYGGRWPDDAKQEAHRYLRKALQWGVEYLDVEVGLTTSIKEDLVARKRQSTIICSYHDLSGGLRWLSPELQAIYEECQRYGDIIMLAGLAKTAVDNHELESFRLKTQGDGAQGLIAFNTGETGHLSRTLNPFLEPVMHPLLPYSAAPSQLSVAEINSALSTMGHMPSRNFYTLGHGLWVPPASFFDKCFNELGLPHRYTQVRITTSEQIAGIIQKSDFGGAVLCPPISVEEHFLSSCTKTARDTGIVDIISTHKGAVIGDSTKAKAIRFSLTRDFAPSAYVHRSMLIVASNLDDALPVVHALRELDCGVIYTSGFKVPASANPNVEQCVSFDVFRSHPPFGVISALPPKHSSLLTPLLRLLGHDSGKSPRTKIFVDLVNSRGCESPVDFALAANWKVVDAEDITAWNAVEILKTLVGQSVPYDFIRMATKRGMF